MTVTRGDVVGGVVGPVVPRRRGRTLIPTAILIIRKSLAMRLVQLAALVGGPEFRSGSSPAVQKALAKLPESLTRSTPPSLAPQNAYRNVVTPPRKAKSVSDTPRQVSPQRRRDYYDADLTASILSASTAHVEQPSKSDSPPPLEAGPVLVAKHRPHRHTQAGDRALKLLLDLEPLDGWDFQQEKNGVKIHTRPVEGVSIPIVRGDGLIEGDWTTQEVFSVIRSSNCRKSWDPRYDMGETIEHFNFDEALSYSVQKGTFPVAARDLVTALFSKRETVEKGGRMFYYVTSVLDPTAPSEGRGRVRAEVAVAGWILRPVPGKGLEASYIVQVDPKGSIPSGLIKYSSCRTLTSKPLCIAEVSRYLSRSEETDDRAAKYELDVTIRTSPPSSDGRRGVFAIALPKVSFTLVRSRLAMGDGVAGSANGNVVIWIDGDGEEVELEVRIEPARHGVVLNGEPVEAKKY
ncbi:hypothetical protein BC829DRAFT_388686 [Chytridium lagenaria]|nr:hypothetical protein BC829DRAFT_388686 [Chytridium lagenaria]